MKKLHPYIYSTYQYIKFKHFLPTDMEHKMTRCEVPGPAAIFNCSVLRTLRAQLFGLLIAFGVLFPTGGQSQVHTYLFDNNFNSSSGGPPLTELVSCGANPGTFGPVTTVNAAGVCLNFNAYCFEGGGGLKYPNTGPYVTGGYTVSMYVKFNSVTSWTRLLDFENSTSDAGIYLFGGCLQAIPWQQPVGPCPSFQANTFYLITFVRDPTTFVSDIYVNGVLFAQLYDSNYPWLRGTVNGINFFRDDNVSPCEAGSGCIAFMQVSPIRATAADVALLWSNIPTLVQAAVSVPPNVSITPANGTLNCTTSTIPLTATGGVTYVWNNGGQTTAGRVVDSASTYTVTVTDVNGCTATASSVITKDITPPTASISPLGGTLTCATTSINLTAAGGASYNWGGGITTATRLVTAPATYTVTVTGNNGCTATATASVGQNITPPVASVNPASATLTCTNTTATLTASGGTSYNWGGGITTAANTVSTANSYTVTVTGTNGCTATANATVTQNTTPPVAAISPAGAALTCAATTATLTASGGISYNWGGGVTTAANTVSAANNYTVTVTGTNGCTATAAATVTQNITPPTATISPATSTLTCGTTSATLTASGGGTYNWGGGVTTAANTVTVPSTYTVTVTATNGCTATASATVNQNINAPVVTISPASFTLTCATTSVTLTANGGAGYAWSGGGNTATKVVSAPGTYVVTATDANGCTASASVLIAQDIAAPTAVVSPASATLSCITTSSVLTATGGISYDWGGGVTTNTNTITTPNTYTVTVTGANGCTANASAVVTQDITPPVAAVAPANATLTCANNTVTLTASGGASYNWGGGITTSNHTVSVPNTYVVTVTGTNGCTATASSVVGQTTAPPVVTISPASADLTCITSSVTLTATGGGSYNWSGGITTATNTVNTADTYTVTVTDANGCSASAAAIVTMNTTPPAATISTLATELTCAVTAITLTANGGGSYDWGGGTTTASTTVAAPNTYTVTVTGTNGCTATASSVITQDISAPTAAVSPVNATITCVVPSVTITASGGVSYDWGNAITTAANTVNSPNTYTVTVTAANGCTATAASVIAQSITVPAAAVSPASATLDCINTSTVLTASGGITYNWGGGVTTANKTVTLPNTYTVTVTDVNGCTASASSVILQDITAPVAVISPAGAALNCVTSSVTLTASGGTTYDWGSGITTATNTVGAANTYTVTVTGTNGCSATAAAAVVQDFTPPAAAITASTNILTCTTLSIPLTATGGTGYDWGGGITTATNTVTSPNTYSVTVTAANGCTAVSSTTITQDITAPVVSITPANATLTCIATTYNLTAAGGATYDWGQGIVTAINSISTPNTYTVTATGSNGCTATAAATITQDITTPNVNIAPASTLTCAVLSSTLQASSTTLNAAYDWGGGVVTSAKTVSTPGNYTVTVTDPANGCTISSSAAVAQDIVAPNIALSNTGTLNCISTSVTINATSTTPNVSYDWGGGNTSTSNIVTTAGSYTITVTDPANSCTATMANAVVQDIAAPPVNIATPAQLNCINASVTITASSTVGAATYDWGNGTLTSNNTVTTPASYSVTVTNPANGCTATATTSVVQNQNVPAVSIITPDTITCHTPSVTLSASTSAVIPAYNWGSGNSGSTFAVAVPGTYTLTITDNDNGCSATASADVYDVPLMNLSETHTNVSCFGFNDATIDLTVSGGQSPFSFTWSNGGANEDIISATAGTQTVTVTDNINCTATISVAITEPASMVITETHNDITCFGNNNGSIDITVSAGMAPYDYRWNTSETIEDRTALAPGTYSVTATDYNSCSVSITTTITEPAEVTMQPTITNPTCATNGNDGSISVVVNGGTTPYNYAWSNNNTTDTNPNLGEGSFGITVTDANSCVVTDMYTLAYQYDFVVDAAPSVSIKLGESTVLDYTLTGNTGNYTSVWAPDYALSCVNCVSPDVTPVYSKLYTVTITNDLGCVSSDTMSVTVVPLYEVFVPNAFTPNGDGVNDLFSIYGNLDGVEYMEIKIFNRLGEKVYESSDHQFTWDGSYKGELQTAQIFTWQMKLTWLNGHRDELRKGTLTLFK
ncbi:MAG TPA: gliding motility-associated C-terminal domain-containing protein [Chitinophagales bacterium]|nr:gliding motility-associated C-terminal domain-containing protein [Chitinophagales bacterium]